MKFCFQIPHNWEPESYIDCGRLAQLSERKFSCIISWQMKRRVRYHSQVISRFLRIKWCDISIAALSLQLLEAKKTKTSRGSGQPMKKMNKRNSTRGDIAGGFAYLNIICFIVLLLQIRLMKSWIRLSSLLGLGAVNFVLFTAIFSVLSFPCPEENAVRVESSE